MQRMTRIHADHLAVYRRTKFPLTKSVQWSTGVHLHNAITASTSLWRFNNYFGQYCVFLIFSIGSLNCVPGGGSGGTAQEEEEQEKEEGESRGEEQKEETRTLML